MKDTSSTAPVHGPGEQRQSPTARAQRRQQQARESEIIERAAKVANGLAPVAGQDRASAEREARQVIADARRERFPR
jgi:hypothetical protein